MDVKNMLNKMLGKDEIVNKDEKLSENVDVIGKVSAVNVMNKITGKKEEVQEEKEDMVKKILGTDKNEEEEKEDEY